MKIVVVYESLFGNTRTIAEDIADGLRAVGDVQVGSVDELSPAALSDATLIVIGGPTQRRGIARPDARRTLAAVPNAKYGSILPGRESLSHWLDQVPAGFAKAAAFDTRYDQPTLITGSAARLIASRLQSKGYSVIGVESFFVGGTGGPLKDGQRERATAWGRELAAHIASTAAA